MYEIIQRITYSKEDSDMISKIKGTYVERPKKVKPQVNEVMTAKKKKKLDARIAKFVFNLYQSSINLLSISYF